MAHLKFDPAKLAKLNDPGRFETLVPEVIVGAFALDAPEVLVEIGAGTGVFAAEFAARYPLATVYAADVAQQMVDWMVANQPEVTSGRIVPVLSTEMGVPLGDCMAGGVYMINLHHELAEPRAIYGEAYRLLAPGGRVLVADWAPIDTPKGPPQYVRVTSLHLEKMLASVGFTAIRTHDGLPWHSLVTAERPAG